MEKTRTERDSFGPIEVPKNHLWGAQTQRALRHFDISTEKMPSEFIRALALVKKACISVNAELGLLANDKSTALLRAAEEVLSGSLDTEFPLSVWQTGSGTQTNMNMNEVLANRATQMMGGTLGQDHYLHPNDDVNLGQSSNDVIPTAMHVATATQLKQVLLPALDDLIASLVVKCELFSEVIKVGRTHLQDAVPLTLGQEFSGYVTQLTIARQAMDLALPHICSLAIGGSAVGTGINTHPQFGERVAKKLGDATGICFIAAPNKFAALAGHEPIVLMHGALKTLAVALMKISTDMRWMASGPRSGLGEILLPENEPGSSIMPGKVNPTQCEALAMICYQVFGNDVTISMSAASGNFELNVFKPVILHNLLQSMRLLATGMRSFEQYCVRGIQANLPRIAELMSRSLMLVTALSSHLGYDRCALIVQSAYDQNITLKEAALASGFVTELQFDAWVLPKNLI